MDGIPGNFAGEPQLGIGTEIGGLILLVVNLLILLNAIGSFLFLIWSGVLYITSEGDPNQTTRAQRALTGAVIGLAITLIAISLVYAGGQFLQLPGADPFDFYNQLIQ